MRSLRNRLIAATLAATLLILLIAAFLIYGAIRGAIVAEFDETLLTKARAIASVVEQDEGGFELELESAQMPEFEPGDRPEYFQLWSSDGSTLAKSASLSSHSLGIAGASEVPVYRCIELPNGRSGRQVSYVTPIRTDLSDETDPGERIERPSRAFVAITVARDTLDLENTLWRLGMLLGSVSLGASMLSVVVLIVVVSFTLRPIQKLATQISNIDASNVLDTGQLDCSIKELDPVVHRLNELLDRLDKAFTREKAFTADVAHELRTPLAGLSAALEVCSSRPRDEAAYQEVVAKCLSTTRAMQVMIENLLTLARADARQMTLQNESLNLIQFATECWRLFEERAFNRGLHVERPDDTESKDIVTDRQKCGLVLSNLFDNAVRHSDHGGTVIIESANDLDEVTFEIRNSGCDLSPDDVEKVFERFWMHDTARSVGAEHCGLGLPLCRKVLEILGGSITVAVKNGTFAVRMSLPVAARDH